MAEQTMSHHCGFLITTVMIMIMWIIYDETNIIMIIIFNDHPPHLKDHQQCQRFEVEGLPLHFWHTRSFLHLLLILQLYYSTLHFTTFHRITFLLFLSSSSSFSLTTHISFFQQALKTLPCYTGTRHAVKL